MDIRHLDLNLLVVLDALLEEGSVTEAARRLGRSQSATSHALARLREALGDPLLVREGGRMAPTARAAALHPALRAALGALGEALAEGAPFDPATSTRRFVIAAPDALALLLPQLLGRLTEGAPGLRLELQDLRAPDPTQPLLDGEVDLMLGVAPEPRAGLMSQALGRAPYGVLLSASHPAAQGPLSLIDYLRYPHVVIATSSGRPGLVGRAIAARGLQRTVGLRVPGFLYAPFLVADTELLFTCPSPLVRPLLAPLKLTLRAPPLPLPRLPTAMVWSSRVQEDAGHRWLRRRVAEVVTAVLAGEPEEGAPGEGEPEGYAQRSPSAG